MSNDLAIIKYIKEELLINNSSTLNSAKIRWGFDQTSEYKYIINRTSYLSQTNKLTERLYHILNGLTSHPLCKCGKPLRFKSLNTGYSPNCISNICMRRDRKWKSSSTTKLSNNKDILNKFKTYINKTIGDVDSIVVKSFIENRIIDSDFGRKNQFVNIMHFKRYKHVLRGIILLTKHIIPYDMHEVLSFEDFRFSERMYIIHNNMVSIPICQCCNTNIKKYISFIMGYGRSCSNACWLSFNMRNITNDVNNQGYKIIENESRILKNNTFQLKCVKCGYEHNRQLTNARWKTIYCENCDGIIGVSREEEEVFKYVHTLTSTVSRSHKITDNRKEIDIFDHVSLFGIEYNGLYWHSTDRNENIKKFKNKHLEKTEWADANSIMLFHIFSHEWKHEKKRNIWKSMISNIYKKNTRIYARKCHIKEISSEISDIFLENNHMQGRDRSSVRLGLFHDNELVSVMTFCKSRYNKNYEWELSRFCSKIFHNIVGGAARLFKWFINNYKPNNIITYANRRYSKGNIYNILGFTFIKNTPPNYFYFRGEQNCYSRNYFQKHLLEKKLEIYDEDKTEFENMFENDYRVFFDSGNMSFEWRSV